MGSQESSYSRHWFYFTLQVYLKRTIDDLTGSIVGVFFSGFLFAIFTETDELCRRVLERNFWIKQFIYHLTHEFWE